MSDERKKPGWAFWATVVIVGLMSYGASIGPGFWAAMHGWITIEVYGWIYAPIVWLCNHSPQSVRDIIRSYCDWWIEL